MESLKALTKRLFRDKRAATAMIFALTTPVVVGGAALAIDLASFRVVTSRMQSAVDAGALAAVMQIEKKGPIADTAVNMVTNNVPNEFGNMTTTGDVTTGTYSKAAGFVANATPANAVRVVGIRSAARSNGLSRIFGLLWGNAQMDVQVTAIAARPANVFYEPPEGTVLDNEAGDFNEMYAYCYDMKSVDPDPAKRRSQMTLIANNLKPGDTTAGLTGGVYTAMPQSPMPWPSCDAKDQSLSFRLRNVRHAKNNPQLWSNPNAEISGIRPGRPEINHYTDTQITNGVETFDSNTSKILETVLCDTSDKCDPSKAGTAVPSGKNRYATKSSNTAGCSPGKFVYFGFEDRPGVNGKSEAPLGKGWLEPGWTDYDYNDIAIRMKCPSGGKLADPYPRLVG